MLKIVGGLKNLRRAPGPQGQLLKVPRSGGYYVYMTENHGSYFPFPTSKYFLVSPFVYWMSHDVDTCVMYSNEGTLGWGIATDEVSLL